jgi:hypothetical protein
VYPRTRHPAMVALQRAAVVAGFTFVLAGGLDLASRAAKDEVPEQEPESLLSDGALTTSRLKATLVLVLDANAPSAELHLDELRQTISGHEETVNAHVVFVVPKDEFVALELWGEATSIAGVHVVRDVDGLEATRLGACSGTTLLYRADRRLLFRGASLQELAPLLDRSTTGTVAPPRRQDAAHRRPGPLDDWIEPGSSHEALL